MNRPRHGRLTQRVLLVTAIAVCAAAFPAAAEEAVSETASTGHAMAADQTPGATGAPYAAVTAPIGEYRLGPGDRVRVVVFGHEDLSGEFEVDGAGRVSLPLIQMVTAAGLTTVDLEQAITDSLQPDYLKNPRVSVETIGYRPVYILGEVRQPGSYPFTNGMTVVNAVALAGGYTYRAAKKKITVTRPGDPEKNKQLIDEDTPIFPGDVVQIPERFF